MKLILLPLLVLICCGTTPLRKSAHPAAKPRTCTTSADPRLHVYDDLRLDTLGLARAVFELGVRGMQYVPKPRPLLILADLAQPSTQKRLYIIDLENTKLLFHTYVAHGEKSGTLQAERFSNTHSSHQSSLGFYRTMGRYMGKHGLSMKLRGLEPGFNNNVFARSIVLHGADYVSEDTIRQTGMLGRSEGCPAVPNELAPPIVQATENGATLFMYFPDRTYLSRSSFLR
jgi:hypothetical protein